MQKQRMFKWEDNYNLSESELDIPPDKDNYMEMYLHVECLNLPLKIWSASLYINEVLVLSETRTGITMKQAKKEAVHLLNSLKTKMDYAVARTPT